MNLLEQAQQVRRRMEDVERLRTDERLRGRISEAATRLQEATGSSARIAAAARELASVGTPFESPKIESAMKKVAEQRELVRQSLTQVDRNPFPNMLTQVENLLEEAERQLREQWQGFVTEHAQIGSIGEEVLASLEQLGGDLAAPCARVRRHQTALRRLKGKSLPQQGDAQRLRDAVQDLRQAQKDLWSSDLSQAILLFLSRSTGRNGAPLDMLTDEVREWLAAHDLIGRFRVNQVGS